MATIKSTTLNKVNTMAKVINLSGLSHKERVARVAVVSKIKTHVCAITTSGHVIHGQLFKFTAAAGHDDFMVWSTCNDDLIFTSEEIDSIIV